MRVLVTNGDTRPALAITRSLGRSGHEVVVAAEHQPSLASVSRFCAGRETYPPPGPDTSSFAQAIVELVVRHKTELLLPVTEIATTLLSELRHRLPPGCVLPLPAVESLQVANDKSRVLALASQLGVPTPQTLTIMSANDATQVGDLPWPVVIKPARSRVLTAAGWLAAGVDYATNPDELAGKLARLPSPLFPVLLQERIVGSGVGLFACYQQGRPVAMFSHRRLREKPPSGGVSVLCESIALDPMAAHYAERLLTELRWHGVAMVEFKRDERNGSLRLMEINGRFWGSLQLAIDAGVDFPALVARIASGQVIEPVKGYQIGARSRWFLGDLDALFAILLRGPNRPALPPGHPGRLRSLLRFLKPWQPNQRNEVFRLADPKPALLEVRQWLGGS